MQLVEEYYDSASQRNPLVDELRSLFKYRELIYQFVSRSLKVRYKRSALGVLWTLLNPLLMMIVLSLVFSNLFSRFAFEHYPVYILSGYVVWMFFSSTSQAAMGELVWSGDLLRRIYVPKSIFAISAVGTGLVNLLISLMMLLVIALILGPGIRPAILVLPLSVLLLAMFALGVGLILSTAAVYFADMVPVYEVLLTIWMYATPIIYPIEIIDERLRWLFLLNPAYHLLRLFRGPVFEGVVPGWQAWATGGAVAFAALLVGGLVFTAKARDYAYRL